MRVFKKINTPFIQSNPSKAIIVVNAKDPQLNTIKSFIQACDDYEIGYTVFVNKTDAYSKPNRHELLEHIRVELGLKEVKYGSAKKNNLPIMKKYLEIWKGHRIIVLGVFNSGKTSLINKICGTKYKVGDIPGTTLKFTETKVDEGTVVIDSVGQLIDIHKPLMVSIDYSDCSTLEEKINKSFDEEILGLVNTKESCYNNLTNAIERIQCNLKNGGKIIVTGAGASALVAKEIAGQGTECGLPLMVFTNDGAEIQPITFSKGLGENEGGISKYISLSMHPYDIVIGVSASGGTGFVFDTLRRAKKINSTLTICITENPDTPLGEASDIVLKSDAKPEGPSSSKIQTAHLVIGHTLMLCLADEIGVTADESVGNMLPETLQNKKMGIK